MSRKTQSITIKRRGLNMSAVMTKKQLEEINNKCSSNWKFDVTFFIFHSIKSLCKNLKVDDTGYFECRLYYNNQNQITLNIKRFNYEKGVTVAGQTKSIILNKTEVKRRNNSKLLDMTEKLTDKQLLKLYTETEVTK